MFALGHAVEAGTGRVDLLACSLLKSQEGKEVFAMIESETQCDFAASDDKTGNPSEPGVDWVMESDDIDIAPVYFHDTSAFDGTFAAHGKAKGISEEEVQRRIDEAAQASATEKEAAIEALKAEHEKEVVALRGEHTQAVAARRAAVTPAVMKNMSMKAPYWSRNIEYTT